MWKIAISQPPHFGERRRRPHVSPQEKHISALLAGGAACSWPVAGRYNLSDGYLAMNWKRNGSCRTSLPRVRGLDSLDTPLINGQVNVTLAEKYPPADSDDWRK